MLNSPSCAASDFRIWFKFSQVETTFSLLHPMFLRCMIHSSGYKIWVTAFSTLFAICKASLTEAYFGHFWTYMKELLREKSFYAVNYFPIDKFHHSCFTELWIRACLNQLSTLTTKAVIQDSRFPIKYVIRYILTLNSYTTMYLRITSWYSTIFILLWYNIYWSLQMQNASV